MALNPPKPTFLTKIPLHTLSGEGTGRVRECGLGPARYQREISEISRIIDKARREKSEKREKREERTRYEREERIYERRENREDRIYAVYYKHLTLPTICSV